MKKFILFILSLSIIIGLVSSCNRQEDLQPSIKLDETMQSSVKLDETMQSSIKLDEAMQSSIKLNEMMQQYRNMTYGDFKQRYKQTAEFFHADRFIAFIPDTEFAVEFTAAECDEDFIYFLKDRDKCTYIEGKLGNMVTGLSGEIELEDFVANLVWRDTEKEGLMPIYSIVQGESTAYYVSDIYAEVEFYSNADNNYDTKLQISLLPSGKIGEDSITWIYLND